MLALRKPRRLPRRGEEDALRLTNPFARQPLLACCSFSHKHGGFQFPRRLSHPDKRRHFHELRSQRTCAARRIRLRRMRLAAAQPPPHSDPPSRGRVGAPRTTSPYNKKPRFRGALSALCEVVVYATVTLNLRFLEASRFREI